MTLKSILQCLIVCLGFAIATGCQPKKPTTGQRLDRKGDEIVICGQYFHTGAPVVLWTDPGGYDAYRTERRFAPVDQSSFTATTQANGMKEGSVTSPNRYNIRTRSLTTQQAEQIRGGGMPLEMAQDKIDQFVYHYDVCGTSRQCFNILHDHRGLSVHFMLDVDGTIYQTLDVKERAWHATKANERSVGIEIANIGAYPANGNNKTLDEWYRKDANGRTRMVLPAWMSQSWIRTPNFIAYPARNDAIVGQVQGKEYRMYDLTPQQYDSLIKLTAALCKNLPKLKCDYPRDSSGKLITKALSDEDWQKYQGLLGHYHVQTNKQDPGPAFQFDKVINGARTLMGEKPLPDGDVNNPTNPSVASK